ncbi:MAG: NAD(P)/FAD-dependent oxidoreductase [Acidimicrobiia bacterium]|nr:NAD(P)/FAD-dependent oxidoreductase [Acidimicrobiia bacterium]
MSDASPVDAVIVGAGPNGLAAAVAIAREGYSVTVLEAAPTIGGGTRTEELTIPGLLHDVCSAVHPFGVVSPFFSTLPLADHGLVWCHAPVDVAHPLDGGRVAVMVRSLDDTVAGLGSDGPAWRRTFGRLASGFPELAGDIMRPIIHVPDDPLRLARFGATALRPASLVARRWKREETRGLFGGIAAHVIHPLGRPTTAAPGLALAAACHAVGWPVARGGSRTITDALASLLRHHGGTIETGVRVGSLAELPPHRVALFDVTPRAFVRIAGDAIPRRVRRAYLRYRHGPAAFKVDLAVEGGVPWTAESARRAGTVHVGGTFEQIATAEREVHAGRVPARPFVLVAQQHVADPTRSRGDVHPIWAYAHVPNGYAGDASEAILDQVERFAPGLRERVVGRRVMGPAAFESYNANYIGGDISTGANDSLQIVMRPRLALDPYATGIRGVFLCSAATPPGAGVHGMCGAGAATSALRLLER